jgi:hypothetical protein
MANHRAWCSHHSNAAHRSHARRTFRLAGDARRGNRCRVTMSDDDLRPLLVRRSASQHHDAQSALQRAQVNWSL